jgi:hypothetical protein
MPPLASFWKYSLLSLLCVSSTVSCSSYKSSAQCYNGPAARLSGSHAQPPSSAPAAVQRAIAAGNSIQNVPYQYGGGHGRPSSGLDCSGTVSYVLRSSGVIRGALASKAYQNFGDSGPGKWISIYARNGHVFMTICGLRLDTTSGGRGDTGPRWSTVPRKLSGFTVRHPKGL